jgi:energy-coupling factor transporter ATP-binding protein EcfA2
MGIVAGTLGWRVMPTPASFSPAPVSKAEWPLTTWREPGYDVLLLPRQPGVNFEAATMIETAPKRPEEEHSTIWQELDEWARDFSPWQRHMIGHCIREGALSAERIDEAYTLFLFEHKLGEAPASTIDIPITTTGRPMSPASVPISIAKIGNLVSINALPADAELTFSPTLTIIYGGNGAGKSGFARILSNICFSRAQHRILPNIYRDDDPAEAAADVVVRIDNEEHTIRLADKDGHTELKRIAMFDTAVARVHLIEQNNLGYKPTGFDVFPEMARCYGLLVQRLEESISGRKRDNQFPNSFVAPPSFVSDAIRALSHDTNLHTLRALATFGEAENARLEEVQRQIGELRADATATAIAQLEEAKRDMTLLATNLDNALALLTHDKMSGYNSQAQDRTAADRLVTQEAMELFRHKFKSAGDPQWESLLAFARDVADLEPEGYPHEGDHCLLCQQPLDAAARTFLHLIWKSLASEAQARARDAGTQVDTSINALEGVPLDFFASTTTCYAHLNRLNPPLAARVVGMITAIDEAYSEILRFLMEGGSLPPVRLADNVITSAVLAEAATQRDQINSDIIRLISLNRKEASKALEAERTLLRHRQVLSQLMPDIEKFVADLAWIETASGQARRSLNPRSLTAKETELFGKVVATDYRHRFADECEELNCQLPVDLKTEGQRGQTVRSFSLKGRSPDEVLSEGEQRSIALADFLTEVGLNDANAGIILDDPVTSQDHYRKEHIAKRLVREASTRQVIILTHDLVFVTMLADKAEGIGVKPLIHWIERDAEGRPGQISLDDSPATTPQYRKTTKAQETCREAKAAVGSKRVKLVQRGMGELRRTIEEIVPHHLLKSTVNRWTDRIIVTALKRVRWDDALVADIIETYEELSGHIEGHTHTEQRSGAPPEPSDLENWIHGVNDLIKRATPSR